LSNSAIRKTGDEPGFQDEELNEAYEIAKNQPDTEFSIIPLRLEDCHRGDHRLTLYQQYGLFNYLENGLDKLAINIGGNSLADSEAIDERSDDERLLDILKAKAAAEYFAGRINDPILLNSIKEYTDHLQLILELKNELRVAAAQIETQKYLTEYHRADITEFRRLIETALRNPVPIEIKTIVSSKLQSYIELTFEVSPQISLIQESLNEFREQLPQGSDGVKSVDDLKLSLEHLEKSNSKEEVTESSAMSKFRRFLENVDNGNTTAGNVIKTTKDGIDIARKLAGQYNQLAQWCGLPQVPEPFTKIQFLSDQARYL
jgi:hypothetical protein